MPNHRPDHDWDDDEPAVDDDGSSLDAFADYAPVNEPVDEPTFDSAAFTEFVPADQPDENPPIDSVFNSVIDAIDPDDDGDEKEKQLVFRVTNPPGSVSVTAYIDGRIAQLDLSPAVAKMTERHLADEIQVLSELVRDQARAGQYALLNEFMTELGHDDTAANSGFLTQTVGLPSPEQANEKKAHVFATRYGNDAQDTEYI